MLSEWIRKHNKSDIDSYKNLKRALGILGMLLPVVCIVGGLVTPPDHAVQISISHFYHTNLRDVLVGLLACVSIILMTYTGYGIIDNLVSWAIGLAGAGIVIFPCPTNPPSAAPVGILQLTQDVSGGIHLVCAGAFFLLLAINSIFLFTVTDPKKWGPKKKVRNVIFIVCGSIILACLAILLIIVIAAPDFLAVTYTGLVFETIMLFAFGVSWLVKGEVPLLRDKKQTP